MKEELIKILAESMPCELSGGCTPEAVMDQMVDDLLKNDVYISKLKLGQGVVWAGYDMNGKAFAIPSIVRGISYNLTEIDPRKLEVWYAIEAKVNGPKEKGEMQIVTEDQLRIDPEVIGLNAPIS